MAGGIPAVLKRLGSKIHNCPTVCGKTIKQIADEAIIYDQDIIRPLNKAYHKEGGIAILYGNLSPQGCVVKQSAVEPEMMKFSGTAKVFDSEEESMKAIIAGKVKKGTVVVIRYEGPAQAALG